MSGGFVGRIRISVVLLLLGLFAAPLAAQSGTVQGRVTDSAGAVISGALVTVEGTSLRASTTSQGRYTIRGVPAGPQTVRARAIGFTPTTAEITVEGSAITEQDFSLGRSLVELAPIDVVIGSRGRHTAAEELAVPVDVFTAEEIAQQGTTETSQILQSLTPSVNFPRQSVTDANDIVRPFTLRGLSPDHTLVLINGWRRHQMAVLNTFAYGMGAGSSGVDLNAVPGSAIERIEVLRDGASAQYGSDAIAGVVNLVMKEGQFSPFLNLDGGRYVTGKGYDDDGTTVDVNGGVGIKLGRGSLGLFGEFQHRDPTNRAWPDPFLADANGVTDSIDTSDGTIIEKRNALEQPNHHWGDGLEKDVMTFANLRMPINASGSTEFYAFGGYSHRVGTGNGFFRYVDDDKNWQAIYPEGFLPEFHPKVNDYSAAGGIRTSVSGWAVDFGASYGRNTFRYDLRNTLNPSLGPCLDVACAPGPDGVPNSGDEIPNQTSFNSGQLERDEILAGLNFAREVEIGLPNPLHVAAGGAYRRESYAIVAGELASWVNGQSQNQNGTGLASAGSSVFSGFSPTDASDHDRSNVGAYLDLETDLSNQVLANVAARYENYSDFGSQVTGKLALRFQPTARFVLRGAASTGFRAPGLAQSYFSHTTTSFIAGTLVEVGNFPVTNRVSRMFGAKPLKEETSVNLSAGFAFTPRDNLTITVDYFHIKINDRILLGATFDGSPSGDPVIQQILADSGITNIAAVQFFTNGLDTKTDGVDVTANLRLPAGEGALDLSGSFNYTRNKITRVDGLPPILRGTGTTYTSVLDLVTTVGIERERPEWRGTLTGNYSIGRFHALGRGSYYGGFRSAQPSFAVAENYGGKALFDAEVGYRFNNINLSMGVRNLFDTYPDQASVNNSFDIFPWAAASPFGYNGRFIYTRAEMVLGW